MGAELITYTGVISQIFYQVYASDDGPLLPVGALVSVQAKVLGGEIVHISLHSPNTGTMVCQQIVATKDQLFKWVVPLNTSIAKVLYGQ